MEGKTMVREELGMKVEEERVVGGGCERRGVQGRNRESGVGE